MTTKLALSESLEMSTHNCTQSPAAIPTSPGFILAVSPFYPIGETLGSAHVLHDLLALAAAAYRSLRAHGEKWLAEAEKFHCAELQPFRD
eukprot:CAMPEP_0119314986 /NCGR_PEP_ID=MMETSP1333-20130426/34142_1 /TAXON_ID=418940 /ORGANISM="Scyphosphaera apsteinii, Strain RCC1455" /LENGTH=89 /DNA_ID=CAMNT_0007320201 /DNA_START=905 /DNA_END=1173 /DNA_ORIENTATION=+